MSGLSEGAQGLADCAARQIAAAGAFSGATVRTLERTAGSGHFSVEVKTDGGYDRTVVVGPEGEGETEEKIQQGAGFSVLVRSLDRNRVGPGPSGRDVSVTGEAGGVSARFWKEAAA